MDKPHKSQIAKLSLIALLFITPLLSTWMRPPYLYFILNLLIIALGAEAGLLSFPTTPPKDKKRPDIVAPKAPAPLVINSVVANKGADQTVTNSVKKIEKSASEKIVGVVKVQKVNRCPSMPSLFFIGSGETEAEAEDEEEEDLSGQELFTQTEMFIGNFHKQLKIQKEKSWRRIHGFYQKAY